MNKLKIFIIFILAAGLISCGKKDNESGSQNIEDKTEQLSDKKSESTEQPADTSNKQKVSKKDTAASKELRFYSKSEKPEKIISPLEAGENIGKVVTVTGFVADVYKTDRVAYLNFIEKFPKNPFSGVIFASRFDTFGDLNIYEGKNVELTGRVTVYKEKPQIILDSKEQIKILN